MLRLGTGRRVNIPSSRVILGPNTNEFIKVMRPEDGGVSGKVLKVIHYHSYKQVQHLEHREQEMSIALLCPGCFYEFVMLVAFLQQGTPP